MKLTIEKQPATKSFESLKLGDMFISGESEALQDIQTVWIKSSVNDGLSAETGGGSGFNADFPIYKVRAMEMKVRII